MLYKIIIQIMKIKIFFHSFHLFQFRFVRLSATAYRTTDTRSSSGCGWRTAGYLEVCGGRGWFGRTPTRPGYFSWGRVGCGLETSPDRGGGGQLGWARRCNESWGADPTFPRRSTQRKNLPLRRGVTMVLPDGTPEAIIVHRWKFVFDFFFVDADL